MKEKPQKAGIENIDKYSKLVPLSRALGREANRRGEVRSRTTAKRIKHSTLKA